MSYYASTSSTGYGYQPLSPPWSQGGSPPLPRFDGPPRAPVMPYATLPPVDGLAPSVHVSPHHGLITPPPTPGGEIHPALCSRHTVVRYDFAFEPRSIRMSSSAPTPSFPSRDPASRPSLFCLYIECEVSGEIITIRSDDHRSGITCFDLLSQLHRYFAQPIRPDEWRCVQGPQRRAMKDAYAHRTGRAYDQYSNMKMIDYLLGQTVFKRLVPKRSDVSGLTWLLQTTC